MLAPARSGNLVPATGPAVIARLVAGLALGLVSGLNVAKGG